MRVERTDQAGTVRWVVSEPTPAENAVITPLRPAPGDGPAFGFPADEPLSDAAAENLSRLLKLLQHGGPGALPSSPWPVALRSVTEALDSCIVDWLLIGSAALAVRGIPVEPGDIDIILLGGRQDALALLRPHLICPLRDLGDLIGAHWFSRAWLGLAVEWMAEPHPDADDLFRRQGRVCEWGRTAIDTAEIVDRSGQRVRVPPLSLHLGIAEQRGLNDQVALIKAVMGGATAAS
jgi:hypothetical protein